MLKSVVIEGKKFKILNLSNLDQGQRMTLTFGTHKASCTHLTDRIYQPVCRKPMVSVDIVYGHCPAGVLEREQCPLSP